ncbi:MAG: DUF1684 domain-containing protein [Thermomicrobiales bacterium]|nr:DUF1684 domain-containing protein [Thermomicrobiales bacterium]
MTPSTGSRLQDFRQRRDRLFANGDASPLTERDRERFSGLNYYPERPDLVLALPLETNGEGAGEPVHLAMSDGAEKPYLRAGHVTFDVDGRPATLTVFTDLGRGHFFLPFKDATSGVETYAGGRYVEPRLRPDGTLSLDFNYAYNPYCAYAEGWSCPIPPTENDLTVPIAAGEKAFDPETGA